MNIAGPDQPGERIHAQAGHECPQAEDYCRAGRGRTLHADLATKSVRKAVKTLLEHGEQNVALIIQGSLAADNRVEEAGITAQVKVQPPSQAPA
jgi:hypothetical protein